METIYTVFGAKILSLLELVLEPPLTREKTFSLAFFFPRFPSSFCPSLTSLP